MIDEWDKSFSLFCCCVVWICLVCVFVLVCTRDMVFVTSEVLHLNGKYGIVIDSTPCLVKVWPLRVEDMQIGGKTVLAATLTVESIKQIQKSVVKERIVKSEDNQRNSNT